LPADSVRLFGSVPGLHAVMAKSPNLLKGYKAIHEPFANSNFDKDEMTVIWQAVSVEHSCIPAHAGIAKEMGISDEISDTLRNETPLPNDRLEALRIYA